MDFFFAKRLKIFSPKKKSENDDNSEHSHYNHNPIITEYIFIMIFISNFSIFGYCFCVVFSLMDRL